MSCSVEQHSFSQRGQGTTEGGANHFASQRLQTK